MSDPYEMTIAVDLTEAQIKTIQWALVQLYSNDELYDRDPFYIYLGQHATELKIRKKKG